LWIHWNSNSIRSLNTFGSYTHTNGTHLNSRYATPIEREEITQPTTQEETVKTGTTPSETLKSESKAGRKPRKERQKTLIEGSFPQTVRVYVGGEDDRKGELAYDNINTTISFIVTKRFIKIKVFKSNAIFKPTITYPILVDIDSQVLTKFYIDLLGHRSEQYERRDIHGSVWFNISSLNSQNLFFFSLNQCCLPWRIGTLRQVTIGELELGSDILLRYLQNPTPRMVVPLPDSKGIYTVNDKVLPKSFCKMFHNVLKHLAISKEVNIQDQINILNYLGILKRGLKVYSEDSG